MTQVRIAFRYHPSPTVTGDNFNDTGNFDCGTLGVVKSNMLDVTGAASGLNLAVTRVSTSTTRSQASTSWCVPATAHGYTASAWRCGWTLSSYDVPGDEGEITISGFQVGQEGTVTLAGHQSQNRTTIFRVNNASATNYVDTVGANDPPPAPITIPFVADAGGSFRITSGTSAAFSLMNFAVIDYTVSASVPITDVDPLHAGEVSTVTVSDVNYQPTTATILDGVVSINVPVTSVGNGVWSLVAPTPTHLIPTLKTPNVSIILTDGTLTSTGVPTTYQIYSDHPDSSTKVPFTSVSITSLDTDNFGDKFWLTPTLKIGDQCSYDATRMKIQPNGILTGNYDGISSIYIRAELDHLCRVVQVTTTAQTPVTYPPFNPVCSYSSNMIHKNDLRPFYDNTHPDGNRSTYEQTVNGVTIIAEPSKALGSQLAIKLDGVGWNFGVAAKKQCIMGFGRGALYEQALDSEMDDFIDPFTQNTMEFLQDRWRVKDDSGWRYVSAIQGGSIIFDTKHEEEQVWVHCSSQAWGTGGYEQWKSYRVQPIRSGHINQIYQNQFANDAFSRIQAPANDITESVIAVNSPSGSLYHPKFDDVDWSLHTWTCYSGTTDGSDGLMYGVNAKRGLAYTHGGYTNTSVGRDSTVGMPIISSIIPQRWRKFSVQEFHNANDVPATFRRGDLFFQQGSAARFIISDVPTLTGNGTRYEIPILDIVDGIAHTILWKGAFTDLQNKYLLYIDNEISGTPDGFVGSFPLLLD